MNELHKFFKPIILYGDREISAIICAIGSQEHVGKDAFEVSRRS